MDKRKGILNVSVSIAFRFVMLIGVILVRRYLIRYIGNEGNGLDSLYASLIGFMSVAELGVGAAVTFCMYKPIVDRDTAKVAALYQLITKLYWIVGAVMLVAGFVILPFLPYLAKDYAGLDVHVGGSFLLMLASVVLSYVFSAKTTLINAYKNNYITTAITSTGMILQYALQIVVVVWTHSFVWYQVCRIVAMLLQWALTEICAGKRYRSILKYPRARLDSSTKTEVIKKAKALFMHRIGGILVNSADSLIISACIGIVALGKYTNYSSIAVSMTSVIALFFSPLTSVIGHMFVEEKEKSERYFQRFYLLNFVLGAVFFLGYYAVVDNLVTILFDSNLELSRSVSFVITVNYFLQFLRRSTLMFRDATGTFYNDRWKPLFEGTLNVILSLLFVFLFRKIGGDEMAMVGVIVATIITNLTICHIVEPYVLYRHAFEMSVKRHLVKNYAYVILFVIAMLVMTVCMQTHENPILELLINGSISVGISTLTALIACVTTPSMRQWVKARCLRQRKS